MSYNYFDTLDVATRGRYNTKLQISGLDECPYRLPADSWKNNPHEWPELLYADLYNYLTNAPEPFSHESMKAYKSLEAHRYFTAGWVQTVIHITTTHGIVFRADVKPSQRLNDDPHHPWVTTNLDGVVLAAHCDCMAGLGECCSHIAAVLFKIEAAVRLGYTTVSVTSESCEWNTYFRENIVPKPVSKVDFYKTYRRSAKPPANVMLMGPSREFHISFLQSLIDDDHLPVGLSTFSETSGLIKAHFNATPTPEDRLPTPLRDLYWEGNGKLTDSELTTKCDSVCDTLSIDADQIRYLEETTRSQASTIAWHEQRAGRITSSSAYKCLHTNQHKPAKSVINSITTLNMTPCNAPSLVYGRKHEDVAYQLFLPKAIEQHTSVTVNKTGMLIHRDHPWLAASSDGVITCDCHGTGVIEIKCPYSYRQCTIDDIINDEKSYIYGAQLLNKHPYYCQVQIEMEVYGANYCEFITYAKNEIKVITISKDCEFIQNALTTLYEFWRTHIVRELLTRGRELGGSEVTIGEAEAEDTVYAYCYCKTEVEGSDMVGCDGVDCPVKWVHIQCIRPKRVKAPKGTWYCKLCKKSNKK